MKKLLKICQKKILKFSQNYKQVPGWSHRSDPTGQPDPARSGSVRTTVPTPFFLSLTRSRDTVVASPRRRRAWPPPATAGHATATKTFASFPSPFSPKESSWGEP